MAIIIIPDLPTFLADFRQLYLNPYLYDDNILNNYAQNQRNKKSLDSLGGGNLLKRSNIRATLDNIGGGNLLRK